MEAQRKLFIGGNWKCNLTLSTSSDLVNNVLNPMTFDSSKVEVAVFPVSIHIPSVLSTLTNKNIIVCYSFTLK
jgi:triosephosphate isomerase